MLALQPTKLTLFSLPSTSRVCSWSTVIATGAHGSLIVIRAAKLAAHFWLPQKECGPNWRSRRWELGIKHSMDVTGLRLSGLPLVGVPSVERRLQARPLPSARKFAVPDRCAQSSPSPSIRQHFLGIGLASMATRHAPVQRAHHNPPLAKFL